MSTPVAGGAPQLVILHVPDCPNLPAMLAQLTEITSLPVHTQEITTDAEAVAAGMSGSPTLLVNGRDPFTGPGPCSFGLACRLYRDEQGRLVPVPSANQMRAAVQPTGTTSDGLVESRTRALPNDPTQWSVLRAILCGFAATGHAPAAAALEPLLPGDLEGLDQVLAAMHEQDTIRLDAAGEVAVAYPFSATPTGHQVHIAGDDADEPGVEVWAMCAIDALGIAAMIDRATRIESIDITTGTPITVTMPAGRSTPGPTRWDPADAVVFVGTTSGGGPSADCCCDHLNFFTDHAAATTWADEHPQICGQILTQRQAEQLAVRLFGHLLHDDRLDR